MLYLKQNLDIVHGLGIHIPSELLAEMEDLQMLPVELRITDEETNRVSDHEILNESFFLDCRCSAQSTRMDVISVNLK